MTNGAGTVKTAQHGSRLTSLIVRFLTLSDHMFYLDLVCALSLCTFVGSCFLQKIKQKRPNGQKKLSKTNTIAPTPGFDRGNMYLDSRHIKCNKSLTFAKFLLVKVTLSPKISFCHGASQTLNIAQQAESVKKSTEGLGC